MEASRSARAAFCSTSRTEVPAALISLDRLGDASRPSAARGPARARRGGAAGAGPSGPGRGPASAARRRTAARPAAGPARRGPGTARGRGPASAAVSARDPARAPRAPARRLSATVIRANTCRPSGTCTTPAATARAGPQPVQRPAVEADVPAGGGAPVEGERPGHRPQQGRLARAVAAEYDDDGARGHVERHVAQRPYRPVADGQRAYLERGHIPSYRRPVRALCWRTDQHRAGRPSTARSRNRCR